ncbi:unnamed protein product [Onchocerca ochengi]|uniref:ATP-dependent DNA helicase n=1 Tax=Onchocerca ochengi TaxID=42157 RepID=A0A182EKZ6_ONCOC|nr:unnamed protein product [Onchocerca ochengi]
MIEDLCLQIVNKVLNQLGMPSPNRSAAALFDEELRAKLQHCCSFVICAIKSKIRSQNGIALALASSGISAALLPDGRTAHSALKLTLNIHLIETPTCSISKASNMGKVLQKFKLVVWDKCTMAHKKSIEACDQSLQDLLEISDHLGTH